MGGVAGALTSGPRLLAACSWPSSQSLPLGREPRTLPGAEAGGGGRQPGAAPYNGVARASAVRVKPAQTTEACLFSNGF